MAEAILAFDIFHEPIISIGSELNKQTSNIWTKYSRRIFYIKILFGGLFVGETV